MKESDLTRKYITEPIRKAYPKAWVQKIPGSTYSLGLPDLLFYIDGQFGAIEVKQEGNPLTALQWKMLESIVKAGGIGVKFVFNRDKSREIVCFSDASQPLVKALALLLNARIVAPH